MANPILCALRLLAVAMFAKISVLLSTEASYRYLTKSFEILFDGNIVLCGVAFVSNWIAHCRDDHKMTVLSACLSLSSGR